MRRFYGFLGIAVSSSLIFTSHGLAQQIIVESRCSSGAAYAEGGSGWANSSSKSTQTSCAGGSRSTLAAGAFADFVPSITVEGSYDVSVTWGTTTPANNGPNADHVQVSIIDRDGTRDFFVDMRGHSACLNLNNDQLVYVGRGYFRPNQGDRVRITNTSTGQCYNGPNKRFATADAVVFNNSLTPALPRSWGMLKLIYRN